jgi:hypothetical protein
MMPLDSLNSYVEVRARDRMIGTEDIYAFRMVIRTLHITEAEISQHLARLSAVRHAERQQALGS